MARSRLLLRLCVLALLAVACSGQTIDSGPQRPDVDAPPAGPVVAGAASGDTTFVLHDEGDGCLAVDVRSTGLQATVERRCFGGDQVVEITSSCGWLAEPPESEPAGCDVLLPTALFGVVTEPAIGHVCVGVFDETAPEPGVTGARFVTLRDGRYILEAARPGESSAAHLFTSDGIRYGEPPLDAPSEPIYRFCEELAPWGDTGVEYAADVLVDLAPPLRTDDVTIVVDVGSGGLGMSGGAMEDATPVDLPARIPASSSGIGVQVAIGEQTVVDAGYPWPEPLATLLGSRARCAGPIRVEVTVGETALDGDEQAITIAGQVPRCD